LRWYEKPQFFVPLAALVGVATLLHTKDALELQRAAIILRQFNCPRLG
jgi:hypothetical protein